MSESFENVLSETDRGRATTTTDRSGRAAPRSPRGGETPEPG